MNRPLLLASLAIIAYGSIAIGAGFASPLVSHLAEAARTIGMLTGGMMYAAALLGQRGVEFSRGSRLATRDQALAMLPVIVSIVDMALGYFATGFWVLALLLGQAALFVAAHKLLVKDRKGAHP